ncbi:hypothetical protein [Deinococcus rufus]|uniref:Uncharacterized protein n=1 Tax=Deinococcus rufus TaxID=2136097 RepID=A0ABV7ZAX9_9DEIO
MTTSLERPPTERWWPPADAAVCAYTVLSRLNDLTYWSRRELFTAADVAEGDDRPHVTVGVPQTCWNGSGGPGTSGRPRAQRDSQ